MSQDTKVAPIGCLGNIPFQVSSKKVQTFENLNWKSSASYATHARHMKTELLEMTGIKADEVSFDMLLSAYLGVKPMKVLNTLQTMLQKGTVCALVLGKDIIGKKWVVTDVGRAVKHVYKDGTLISCQVNVTLKQYT